jgi:hypothetical protein
MLTLELHFSWLETVILSVDSGANHQPKSSATGCGAGRAGAAVVCGGDGTATISKYCLLDDFLRTTLEGQRHGRNFIDSSQPGECFGN